MSKKSLPKVVICDLDGTLCQNTEENIEAAKAKDWDKFSATLGDAGVNRWCQELIEALWYQSINILFLTGRSQKDRKTTEDWLNEHQFLSDGNKLFMPRGKTHRAPSHEVKTGCYLKEIKGKYDVLFVLDDRRGDVKAYREAGLTVLHCAEGDY